MTSPDLLTDPACHARGDAWALWEWLRRRSPVHRHDVGNYPAFWSVTTYEDVRAVYRDPARFSSRHGVMLRPIALADDPGAGQTLALTDPPRHRHLRTLLAPFFTDAGKRQEAIRRTVRDAIDVAVDRGECDFAHDIAARVTLSTVCTLLGAPEEDHDQLFRWTCEAFAASRPLAAHQELMRYFVGLIDERLSSPAEDIVTALLDEEVEGDQLSEEEVLLNMENLLGAAENAGLSMAAGMQAFIEHPDQWARLRADRSLTPTAIEEVLRWASSATHSMRVATADCDVRDQRIQAGDRVVLWLPSANRDEAAFPAPNVFDIGRRPNRHVALGAGEHLCIGATIARTQAKILFGELLDLGAEISMAGEVVPVQSIVINGPAHLPVSFALP